MTFIKEKSLLKTRRDRVIHAKLDSLARHVGKHIQLANLSDGSRVPVELSPEILEKALIKIFESGLYEIKSHERAEKIITDHYSDCMSKAYSKLTPHGMTFMNAVIDELAERAFEKKGDEKWKLNKPQSTKLSRNSIRQWGRFISLSVTGVQKNVSAEAVQ